MIKKPKWAPAAQKAEAKSATALDRYFGLTKQGTDVRTEFIVGVTTFLTMVYIVFVNPIILGKTGMDQGAVFVAACIAAAVSTFVMPSTPTIRSRSRPAWASTRSSHSPSC
ncbi:MAG: hypothetical protein WCF41_04840 [Pseudolabrys sp.]